jgi:hypothetical protein
MDKDKFEIMVEMMRDHCTGEGDIIDCCSMMRERKQRRRKKILEKENKERKRKIILKKVRMISYS